MTNIAGAQRPYTYIRPFVQLRSGKKTFLKFPEIACLITFSYYMGAFVRIFLLSFSYSINGRQEAFQWDEKRKKIVPFPARQCIFLRTYLLTIFCGKRKKRHFPDLQFKNILGNMRPDSLFWSSFRALTFLPVRTPSKSLAMPLHAPKTIF